MRRLWARMPIRRQTLARTHPAERGQRSRKYSGVRETRSNRADPVTWYGYSMGIAPAPLEATLSNMPLLPGRTRRSEHRVNSPGQASSVRARPCCSRRLRSRLRRLPRLTPHGASECGLQKARALADRRHIGGARHVNRGGRQFQLAPLPHLDLFGTSDESLPTKDAAYFLISSSSTSNTSVALGGIIPPTARFP